MLLLLGIDTSILVISSSRSPTRLVKHMKSLKGKLHAMRMKKPPEIISWGQRKVSF